MRGHALPLLASLSLACAALGVEAAKTTLSYCPVSGVALRVKESTLKADLNGNPLYVCCAGCLRYLQANRERVLALRGLVPRG